MNANLYWPVYKNVENEILGLMNNIHFDDDQLNVYSSKIIDLILRISAEIESISKELYNRNGGEDKRYLKFDEDCLKFLDALWNLKDKVVILSSYNCFISNKNLYPFVKNEQNERQGSLKYSWNNAYQHIKHDRVNSLKYGSIKYLLSAASALYLLNIYYKDITFDLGYNYQSENFDNSMGSEIFSIISHFNQSISVNQSFNKNPDFDNCTYLIKPTEESYVNAQKEINTINEKYNLLFVEEVKNEIQKRISISEDFNQTNVNEIVSEVGKRKEALTHKAINPIELKKVFKFNFEAVLNKNQY